MQLGALHRSADVDVARCTDVRLTDAQRPGVPTPETVAAAANAIAAEKAVEENR